MTINATTINKSALVDKVASNANDLSNTLLEKAIDTIFDEITTALVCGDRIEIRGFGSLVVKKRKEGVVRNPKSGEKITASDRGSLYFRASRDLIKSLNFTSMNDN
jgi:integration host factor subunit beta